VAGPYSATILDHFKQPRNRGSLPAPTVAQEGTNPLCGDRVRIELALDGEETLSVPELITQLKSEIPGSRLACVRLPLTVLHTGLLRYTRSR